MSYVVLARKWRPMRFEDLVGQDHVARTLGNAIESGRVAHAFLFTGVRGVGKTTSARILAKALNCMGKPGSVPAGEDPGPTVTPCLECPACQEIALGTDMDVREIDGASYNGVDEVRKLQDSLPYRPTRDRFKIFIVDEVHMLSAAAWNAFLKTLEEPPPHVKFIFATTEVHKVPVTILSRVQRFDFKMISTRAIAERLRYVLSQEGIEADDAGVNIIAREAAGSMRDAMSLLDQVIAFCGSKLTADDVAHTLGVASRQALHDLTDGLVRGDAARCLEVVDSVAEQGFDIPHVARDLLALLRDLVVVKVVPDPGRLLDLADEERTHVAELAQGADPDDLLRLHQGFSRGYDEVVRSAEPRASLEMLLVRLARRPPLIPLDDLIGRLGQLERRLAQGGARPRGREGESRSASSSRTTPSRDEPPSGPGAASHQTSTDPGAAFTGAHRGGATRSVDPAARRPMERDAVAQASAPRRTSTQPPAPLPQGQPHAHAARTVAGQTASGQTASGQAASGQAAALPDAVAPFDDAFQLPDSGARSISSPASDTHALPAARAAMRRPPLEPEEEARLLRLRDIVEQVRASDIELAAYFEQTVPLIVEPGRLDLAIEPGFVFRSAVTTPEARAKLEEAATVVLGAPTELRLVEDEEAAAPHRTLSALREREREARRLEAINRARSHPRVVDAIEVLGARLKEVKLAEG